MTRMRAILFATIGLMVLAVGAPVSAAQLDRPTLRFVEAGLYRITIEVKAGASGAPAGFAIEWMTRAAYDRNQGWPTDPAVIAQDVAYCGFTGVPTLNPVEGGDFKLGGDEALLTQVGDYFDETGMYATYAAELPAGTEYVFRAHAKSTGTDEESADSDDLWASTLSPAECTQGFWKNHPDVWPAGCTPMLLGTVAYTQAQLLAIYFQPAGGNGLIFLAHQLITAKLNGCNGSDLTPIAATIAAADALIDGQVVPPIGGGYIAPGDASGLTETLDDYNNGLMGGVINCPTPTTPASWGAIKSRYH